MKKRLTKRKVITIAVIVATIAAVAISLVNLIPYWQAKDTYDNLSDDIFFEDNVNNNDQSDLIKTSNGGESISIDLETVKKQCPEFVGWIYQRDLGISYPVVKHEDNSYYLKHDATKNFSVYGAIFLDYHLKSLKDKNAIVFGHAMNDGSMFRRLLDYKDPEFVKKDGHDRFIIIDEEGKNHEYYVWSVMIAYSNGIDNYIYDFGDEPYFKHWVDGIRKFSLCQTDMEYNKDSNIITLSTCATGDASKKLVIHLMEKAQQK